MNLKGKLVTNLSLSGNASIPTKVNTGGASTWNEITGKPFSTVDTENGLAIYDNTLMIDTLDKIATIDYVDGQIDAVEAEIPSLDGYATEQYVDDAVSSAQSDWNESDSTQLDYIKNKPPIKAGRSTNSIVEGNIYGPAHINTATAQYAHAEGYDSHATSMYSHAENSSTASGLYSHSEGAGTVANSKCQHVQGSWNIVDDFSAQRGRYADIIGNGETNSPSNAEATDWNGNKYLAGDVYTNVVDWSNPTQGADKLASESYVDTAISNIPDPDWSDVQNKPTFATVATSGDYDDLDNKPTIPQADGTTIIDNNGVFSATASGVDIDNKSIIKNQDDELQTAVPAYRELVSETDEGLYFTTFTYPAGNDLDAILNTGGTHITLDTSNDAYTVIAVINGVMYTGNWTASPNSSSYEYGGGGKWKVTSPITGNYELYWQWRNNTEYKIHIYMNGQYIQRDKVSELIIIPNNSGDTLLSQLETLQLDSYIGTIKTYNYHKIPAEYLDVDTTVTVEDLLGNGTNALLRGSQGINVGRASGGGNTWVNVSQKYNELVSCEVSSGQIVNRLETAFAEPDYNYSRTSSNWYLNYKTDGTLPMYESPALWIGTWKSFIFTLSYSGFQVSMLGDPVNKTISGYEKFCDSYEFFTGDGSTTHNGKVYPNGQTYIILINPKWTWGSNHAQLRGTVYASTTTDALFAWNTLQPYNIPIDNETLEITNGKIKTAIPAPPTTDGTYTLQVTVSSGVVTYSWI